MRLFHSFDSNEVIRECTGLEADYDEVKGFLEKREDLSPLTDPNWVYATLKRCQGSRGKGKPWPGLGRRVEVMILPGGKGVQESMEKLSL